MKPVFEKRFGKFIKSFRVLEMDNEKHIVILNFPDESKEILVLFPDGTLCSSFTLEKQVFNHIISEQDTERVKHYNLIAMLIYENKFITYNHFNEISIITDIDGDCTVKKILVNLVDDVHLYKNFLICDYQENNTLIIELNSGNHSILSGKFRYNYANQINDKYLILHENDSKKYVYQLDDPSIYYNVLSRMASINKNILIMISGHFVKISILDDPDESY